MMPDVIVTIPKGEMIYDIPDGRDSDGNLRFVNRELLGDVIITENDVKEYINSVILLSLTPNVKDMIIYFACKRGLINLRGVKNVR